MKKDDLKVIARKLEIPGWEKMTKEELLNVIPPEYLQQEEEIIEPIKKEQSIKSTKKIITNSMKVWKEYLERIGTTPQKFLNRYPNHSFKQIIEKLIN